MDLHGRPKEGHLKPIEQLTVPLYYQSSTKINKSSGPAMWMKSHQKNAGMT
jgi:hypothetical protein